MEEAKRKQINQFYQGCIIYRYDGDNLIQKRIVVYKESKDWFIVRDENKKEESIPSDDIINNWILLKPDGVITISVCKLQQGNDVLICLHNLRKQMDSMPDAVCRQSIVDMFTDTSYRISPEYKMTGKEILFVGASFTQETCPAEVDFRLLVSCESLESTTKCAYYLTDDLEDILSFIRNTSKYNKVLAQLKDNGLETAKRTGIPADGYQSTLRDLLVTTKFMDDIHRVYDIRHLNFDLYKTDSVINPRTDPRFVMFMSQVVEEQITGMYVQKFSREIDLNQIKRSYKLCIPYDEENKKQKSAKDMYIVGYDLVK